MRVPVILAALLTLSTVSACSGEDVAVEPRDGRIVAESMITGELAATIGLGPLTPACDDPGPLAVGAAFTCTAIPVGDGQGEPIRVRATVNPDGHLGLATVNLITPEALPSFEREAASQLNESVGSSFTAESVDCGNGPVVLPPDASLGCALTMPASGQVFDVTLTITDLDGRRFGLVVAPTPRP